MDIPRIEPDEAKGLLESEEAYVYLDVRSREEFAAGHAPGSVNIPILDRRPGAPGLVPNPDFLAQVEALFDKDTPLITACLRGGRSLKAATLLATNGFTRVVDMRGGWDGELDPAGNVVVAGWSRRGFPSTTE